MSGEPHSGYKLTCICSTLLGFYLLSTNLKMSSILEKYLIRDSLVVKYYVDLGDVKEKVIEDAGKTLLKYTHNYDKVFEQPIKSPTTYSPPNLLTQSNSPATPLTATSIIAEHASANTVDPQKIIDQQLNAPQHPPVNPHYSRTLSTNPIEFRSQMSLINNHHRYVGNMPLEELKQHPQYNNSVFNPTLQLQRPTNDQLNPAYQTQMSRPTLPYTPQFARRSNDSYGPQSIRHNATYGAQRPPFPQYARRSNSAFEPQRHEQQIQQIQPLPAHPMSQQYKAPTYPIHPDQAEQKNVPYFSK